MRVLVGIMVVAIAASAQAAIVFQDDFESGNMNNWTTTGTNPLVISTAYNAVPAGAGNSAYMNISTDRMHRNIIADNGGSEVDGASTFTSWIYFGLAGMTRCFNEVRGYSGGTGLPNGGTTASGSLGQLLAIGVYNSVTMAGEVYNGTKFQARVTNGANTGWFNLNDPGSPNRSVGWHKFTIERLADNTTIKFYVNDILSRTITGATAQTWDTLVIAPGLGTTVGDAYIDGIVLTPEPAAIALLGLGGLLMRRRRA